MHELELLQSIYASSKDLDGVTIGPGDDMGEVQVGDRRILCAVDHLIVGRHVTPDTLPELIGRKAIARCLSDVAAMCAKPIGCLMTSCISSDTENEWCTRVFSGAKEAAEQWGAPIFGGDIASCDQTKPVFTVTALATPPASGAMLRSGAQVGDYVCVTGSLGNAIAGHHLTFVPRISEAEELLQTLDGDLHSMIDVSDGLGQDASRLAKDGIQLVIDTALLPLRSGATIEGAISEGEDYELLFTSATEPPKHLASVIGKVEKGDNRVTTTDGKDISNSGWVHE